jgi:ferredoxin, 2Fe-2S
MAAMPRLNVVMRRGETRSIEADSQQSLKEALLAAGIEEIDVLGNCGGCCCCGTCHVFLETGHAARLPPMQPQEDDLLGIHDTRRPTSRLSCQVILTDDLDGSTVIVAPEQ